MEYVYECKTLIPEDFCVHLIEKFERDIHKKIGQVGQRQTNTHIRNNIVLELTNRDDWKEENEYLHYIMNMGMTEYISYIRDELYGEPNKHNISRLFAGDISISDFLIQKYSPGEHFDWHTDNSQYEKRMITFIMYLNTMDENSGGETQFWKGKNIIPKRGNVIFFPSTWTYLHRGDKVLKGAKYIVTGFIHENILRKKI